MIARTCSSMFIFTLLECCPCVGGSVVSQRSGRRVEQVCVCSERESIKRQRRYRTNDMFVFKRAPVVALDNVQLKNRQD